MLSAKRAIIKKNFWLFAILSIIIMATSKYIRNGEEYVFATSKPDDVVKIGKDDILSQEIPIPEGTKWNENSFCLQFQQVTKTNSGNIEMTLTQNGEVIDSCKINVADIAYKEFISPEFHYNLIDSEKGKVFINVIGGGLASPVGLRVTTNTYNMPNCILNGTDTGKILILKISYHLMNKEYKIRILVFLFFVALILFTVIRVLFFEETRKNCNIVHILMTLMFPALAYLYDSSMFWEPVWCEAGTNFLANALEKHFFENFLLPDSGYLPLMQRLITLFYIKIVRLPAYYAAFAMQITAYVICGYVLTFFVKKLFISYMQIKYRAVISLLMCMQVIALPADVFINFVPHCLYLILLFFLIDEKELRWKDVIFLSGFAFLTCLSKGQFVIVLPFLMVSLLLFYRTFSIKEKFFMLVTGIGSFLQLLYYLVAGSDSVNWFDRKGTMVQGFDFIVKIACEIIRDLPMQFLAIFENDIDFFDGIAIYLILISWAIIIYIFYKHVFCTLKEHKRINRNIRNIMMNILFILLSAVFFKVTVYGVGEQKINTSLFEFFYQDIQYRRYEIFSYFAVIICFLIFIYSLRGKKIIGIDSEILILSIFFLCLSISNPRFQINGVDQDTASNERRQLSTLTSNVTLWKNIESVECRVVPLQSNRWVYLKNAKIYCLGNNSLGWDDDWLESEIEGDVSFGQVFLSDYPDINVSCGIWQIFVERRNLLTEDELTIILKDKSSNVIKQVKEDGPCSHRTVSFTFDEPVYDIAEICIVNEKQQPVMIQNSMYFVTSENAVN